MSESIINIRINNHKMIEPIDFDWQFYINNYPDLLKNGINNKYKALQHWNRCGKNEGRIYNQYIGNPVEYINDPISNQYDIISPMTILPSDPQDNISPVTILPDKPTKIRESNIVMNKDNNILPSDPQDIISPATIFPLINPDDILLGNTPKIQESDTDMNNNYWQNTYVFIYNGISDESITCDKDVIMRILPQYKYVCRM